MVCATLCQNYLNVFLVIVLVFYLSKIDGIVLVFYLLKIDGRLKCETHVFRLTNQQFLILGHVLRLTALMGSSKPKRKRIKLQCLECNSIFDNDYRKRHK